MDLQLHLEELHQEIELLTQAQDQEEDKEKKKPFKRRLDQRQKDLQKVEDALSHQECFLGSGWNTPQPGVNSTPSRGLTP